MPKWVQFVARLTPHGWATTGFNKLMLFGADFSAALPQMLALLGFANMEDYIRIGANGDPYIDLSELTREQAAAISEVAVDDYMDGRGKDAREVKKVRLKFHDKKGALVEIGKHLGMFIQRHEVSGKDGGPIEHADLSGMTNEELVERLKILRGNSVGAKEEARGDGQGAQED